MTSAAHFCCVMLTLWPNNDGIASRPLQYEDTGVHSAYVLSDVARNVVFNHSRVHGAQTPLFLYLATQTAHAPYEAPADVLSKYNHIMYVCVTLQHQDSPILGGAYPQQSIKNTKRLWSTLLVPAGAFLCLPPCLLPHVRALLHLHSFICTFPKCIFPCQPKVQRQEAICCIN